MKGDQVEKKILEVDGEELEGLINLDEYIIEDGVVEIPGRNKIISVRDGVKKIPPIPAVFKNRRNSATAQILQDWYDKKEFHDVTLIRTDGSGKEIARELWPNTEISKYHAPAYDASSPVASQMLVQFLPEDITPIAAEA